MDNHHFVPCERHYAIQPIGKTSRGKLQPRRYLGLENAALGNFANQRRINDFPFQEIHLLSFLFSDTSIIFLILVIVKCFFPILENFSAIGNFACFMSGYRL